MFGFGKKAVNPDNRGYERQGVETPSVQWLANVHDQCSNTPDSGELYEKDYHLVFFYDQLMSKRDEHWLVKDHALYNGPDIVTWRGFTVLNHGLWVHDLRSHKTAIPLSVTDADRKDWEDNNPTGSRRAPPAKVKGELYLVRPELLFLLDKDKQNGVEFERKRVLVRIPYRKVVWVKDPSLHPDNPEKLESVHTSSFETKLVHPWMYVGVDDYWAPRLDSGYHFTPAETFVSARNTYAKRFSYFRE
jgi:hypothetical protein